jgi:hypothetical protein
MDRAKLIVSAGIALAIGIAVGCSSSSSGPGPVPDGGVNLEASVIDGGSEDNSCNPLLGELCAGGQICCSSGLRGTCVDPGSCSSPFQVGCVTGANCNGGVCCGSVQLPAGFDASAFVDASFDAGQFDASEFGLKLVCETRCAAGEFQLCTSAHDCPAGDLCGGGSMMGGGLGVPLVLACFPADAGQSIDSDAESGSTEASTADAAVESGASDGG